MGSILSCVHTHNTFCDGKQEPEAMVLSALEKGFVSLGISSHSPEPFDDYGVQDEAAYCREIQRLQEKYRDRIELLLGLEHEALAPYSEYPYDYQIESCHYLVYGGEAASVDNTEAITRQVIDRYCGGDPYRFCRDYFRVCAEAYQHTPAVIAGHLDLVTKFNEDGHLFDEEDPRYLGPAMEALETAVKKDLVLEVNTGAMARGYRTTPYPGKTLLKRILELGGRLMLNSDCHNAPQLGWKFDETEEYLKSFGVSSLWVLRKSGWTEVPLR